MGNLIGILANRRGNNQPKAAKIIDGKQIAADIRKVRQCSLQ